MRRLLPIALLLLARAALGAETNALPDSATLRDPFWPIGYAPRHPYFFHDANDDGSIGEDEAQMPNKFTAWTPRLLQAAYNYQYVQKDPGAFAHNPKYVIQFLYDNLASLGEQVDDGHRPRQRRYRTAIHRNPSEHHAGSSPE